MLALAQRLLARAQLLKRPYALTDLFAKDDDAANFASRVTPGPDLPSHPLHRSIAACEGLPFASKSFTGEGAPVVFFPMFGNFRKYLVVRLADNLTFQTEVFQIAAARREIALSCESLRRINSSAAIRFSAILSSLVMAMMMAQLKKKAARLSISALVRSGAMSTCAATAERNVARTPPVTPPTTAAAATAGNKVI